MYEEQCNNGVEVNWDFWRNNDYMEILNSGVPLYVNDSRDNWFSAIYCAKPEIYHHPSIVNLLKSAPVLHENTACHALGVACESGDIERVRELLTGGLADINNVYYDGLTPLMIATKNNQTSVVSLLLTHKDLALDKATKWGLTALHIACGMGGDTSFPVIPLLGSDKRCTPVVLNKKANNGDTPVMWAVLNGNLQSLKEMEKLQGTNFRTENKDGVGLLDVALKRTKTRIEKHMSVLEYLLNRRKVDSLKVLAAHAVASLLSCDTDVDKLDVPLILHPWVTGFLKTSPNIDSWSESSDDVDFSSNDEDEN